MDFEQVILGDQRLNRKMSTPSQKRWLASAVPGNIAQLYETGIDLALRE